MEKTNCDDCLKEDFVDQIRMGIKSVQLK